MRPALLLSLAAVQPMPPEDFESFATGRTFDDKTDPISAHRTFWFRDGALSTDGQPGEEFREVVASDRGVPCPGPDVGV